MKKYLILLFSMVIFGCSSTNQILKPASEQSSESETVEPEKKDEAPKVEIVPPEIRYSEPAEAEGPTYYGTEALKQNLNKITVKPEFSDGRLKGWRYQKGMIYEIHCQTYHSTVIQFEPGEKLIEVPYISEPDIWRLARGIGQVDGLRTEYLMIKPDYGNQSSSLVVITDKRIYQMEIKSFRDHYMPTVSWAYPKQIEMLQSYLQEEKEKEFVKKSTEFTAEDLRFISFNYSIKYRWFRKKPIWKPVQVYDNGKFTYIVLDEKANFSQMPACFINNKEITNKEYHRNIIVINQLITKVTLKLGKDKVVIKKKKGK